jgi:hypothetical protein
MNFIVVEVETANPNFASIWRTDGAFLVSLKFGGRGHQSGSEHVLPNRRASK